MNGFGSSNRLCPSSGDGLEFAELGTTATPSGIEMTVCGETAHIFVDSTGFRWTSSSGSGAFIPFTEILAVRRADRVLQASVGCPPFLWCKEHITTRLPFLCGTSSSTRNAKSRPARLRVYCFTRGRALPKVSDWHPQTFDVCSTSDNALEELLAAISSGISSVSAARPRRVLVVLNPNAGSQQARAVYDSIVQPVLALGGVSTQVLETLGVGHAAEIVRETILEHNALRGGEDLLDGIIAVGGDGAFNEVVNGFLAACAALPAPAASTTARHIRFAHIPCGSTDAVACSLNGSRSVFTAAMHVALGDRTALDVLKVDIGGNATRYACCIVTYGFMGDVVQASERHRWLGPLRYDLLGAAALAANRSYACELSYLLPNKSSKNTHVQTHILGTMETCASSLQCRIEEKEDALPCVSHCQVCRAASLSAFPGDPPSSFQHTGMDALSSGGIEYGKVVEEGETRSPGSNASIITGAVQSEGEWKVVTGEFMSVMAINQPCRSDKTPLGMAKYGHLANGRFTLVLVRRCSPMQYLKFLLAMSSSGLFPGQMPGVVDVIEAVVACKMRVTGDDSKPTSHWNVDGELMNGLEMTAVSHLGAIQYFGRGPEG